MHVGALESTEAEGAEGCCRRLTLADDSCPRRLTLVLSGVAARSFSAPGKSYAQRVAVVRTCALTDTWQYKRVLEY